MAEVVAWEEPLSEDDLAVMRARYEARHGRPPGLRNITPVYDPDDPAHVDDGLLGQILAAEHDGDHELAARLRVQRRQNGAR